jgi:hypothetical protein
VVHGKKLKEDKKKPKVIVVYKKNATFAKDNAKSE